MNQLRIFQNAAVMKSDHSLLIAFLFLIQVVLALSVLTPNLKDIGGFDEALYIQMGRLLASGELPSIDHSPLTAFFFMLAYLPVSESAFWFIHSCTLGRFMLFGLLWFSAYTTAKRLTFASNPLLMIGLIFVSPVLATLIKNGSHALFAAISTAALAQTISFHYSKSNKHLLLASVLLALGILCRMGEGTCLALVFITFAAITGVSIKRVSTVLGVVVLPFILIVGGYMLTYYSCTGRSPLGTGKYFYLTFEQGHGLAYSERFPGKNFWIEGQIEARRLFGSPEQNHHSVLAAIQRNPTAYLERVPRLMNIALLGAIGVYGGPLSVWLFLMAARGCIALLTQKRVLLLSILLSWASYFLIYILLVFQMTNLLLPYVILYCLASAGLTAVVLTRDARERWVWSCILVALIAVLIGSNASLSFLASAVILLSGLWIVWKILDSYQVSDALTSLTLIFLLFLMSLLQDTLPLTKPRKLGVASDEKAVLFLQQNWSEGTPLAAYSFITPWAAKMTHVGLYKTEINEMRSADDLQRWIAAKNLQLIYSDHSLEQSEPVIWALIESEIGKSLEVAFSSEDDKKIRILRVRGGVES